MGLNICACKRLKRSQYVHLSNFSITHTYTSVRTYICIRSVQGIPRLNIYARRYIRVQLAEARTLLYRISMPVIGLNLFMYNLNWLTRVRIYVHVQETRACASRIRTLGTDSTGLDVYYTRRRRTREVSQSSRVDRRTNCTASQQAA